MKTASNKSESKKRKRDDSQESIPESTKKAKVHAQRKFAQGAAFSSPVITPIKDKVRPPAAVPSSGPFLTGKCPNTEDFLTFLCFRRTSILPAKLDFFKDGFESESKFATSSDKSVLQGSQKSGDAVIKTNKKSDKNDEGKKSQTPAVQALCRKYQEQRLAKQKPTNVTRLAKKVKGKNMVRTRSCTVTEETKISTAKKHAEKEMKTNVSGLRSGLKRIQSVSNKMTKKSVKPKHLRTGLRSGGSVSHITTKETKLSASGAVGKKTEKETKKLKAEVSETKVKPIKAKKTEGFSDFSSDDNEPLLAVKKLKAGGQGVRKIAGAKARMKIGIKKRMQVEEGNSSKILLRPTRKTKEAAALYMEMITKKLVSPEKSGDDDMSSVDSFPELPNVKRTEQRETEIKAKVSVPKKPDEKGKETKKRLFKGSPQTFGKTGPKITKDAPVKTETPKKEPKTQAKQDESGKGGNAPVKKPKAKAVKESKILEEKKEQMRPSTRSRPLETAVSPKKPTGKLTIQNKPKPKANHQKETEKRAVENPMEVNKKPKVNKGDKPTEKSKTEQTEVTSEKKSTQKEQESAKTSDYRGAKQESGKSTKKNTDKKFPDVEEKEETAGRKGKKEKKLTEPDPDTKKPKGGEKKTKKYEDGRKRDEENVNKRPTRKCSTADKIWIDIDGFTSDEEDFLEVSTLTKTRASTKKAHSKNEKTELENITPHKTKQEKAKESVAKTEEKKQETKKTKPEVKHSEEVPVKTKPESKHSEEVPTKIKPEVKHFEEVPAKTKPESKHFEEVPVKTSSESKHSEEVPAKTKPQANEAKSDSNGTGNVQKLVSEPKTDKKAKAEVKPTESDTGKKEKHSEENVKKGNEVAKTKGGKKDEKKDTKERKKLRKSSKQKQARTSEKEEEEVTEKRTRPVRQCSTGEKRWIETDSDSFSFYETSDDEDNLPIVDFSKIKHLNSESEAKRPEKTEKKAAEEKKVEENFSESDEEPLKKKAHVQEMPKKVEIEVKSSGKTQREVPGLTPLKKSPSEIRAVINIPQGPKLVNLEPKQLPITIPSLEPKPLCFDVKDLDLRCPPLHIPQPIVHRPISVPNRIEMILHSLKRDKVTESSPSRSNDVQITFGNVPYQPLPHSSQNQIPCTYQVKATFPSGREPISTHGLDLLSEVALPTTPKENITSQTKRIEKWLNDSLAADQKDSFPAYETAEYKPGVSSMDKPQPETEFYFGKPGSSPVKTCSASSQSEIQKFGQTELFESQKLLKKNLLAAEVKQDAARVEQQQMQSTPKKTVTSVQDLLKLQKERKEVTKTTENAPHLKNCKCNNCVVKKGWFKNKPVPKVGAQKSSPPEESEENSKPFESLTKALIGESKNLKMSVSVAPMVVSQSTPSSSKQDGEKKGAIQQKKLSFLERMKERERKEAAAKQNSNAFSPNNESSVYAFEPEPEQTPGTNTPFRSKTRESRTSSTSRSDDEGLKICEDESPTLVSDTQTDKPGIDKTKASLSASIAVQVNLDSESGVEAEPPPELQDGKSIEISTQTEVAEEDSDSPMFYIPLQQTAKTGASVSSDQQLIQGVALKLGTEGPLGPNQRVIMKAKLVTKPPESGSIKAVVMPQPKRMFDQKYNNPPIGTVQPTTRKPPVVPPVTSKPESAKPVVVPPAEPEVSATVKTEDRPQKIKEKSQAANKEKQESAGENLPCTSASAPKTSKRPGKQKSSEPTVSPSNNTSLPPVGSTSKLVEAPTFHPTEKDFQDPFEFFDRIRPAAEKFGLCRIVPPSNFKPDCKVSDNMRFTAYNQYVHRMFHRWGPNIKEMMAIKKYLATQSISLKQPPWIGGIEIDLPRLYQSVQNCGGLMKVMEKKKWHQVADMMKIPKAAQDRVTKLDDIYCKYLLPYDTLSHDERQMLFDEVEKDWQEMQKTPVESQEGENTEENYIEECEECVVKGRNMALNQFYRIARNTMSMWFKNPEPTPREVETEFWKHVSERNHHVCVHSGSIDSSGWGYGFPIAKNNSFSKHPWNLKVLTNNSGSVLRYLGPVMGVTVPTLHVGMVFTAFCWYRDPHGLPWIEYLHTGAPKIWHGISDDNSVVFQEALAKLLPRYIKNKTIWLPSDTAMIPPELLVEHGVSLCHTVQEPGQFILVFPRAFTSSICTGYLVSESVYFAQLSWLTTAEQVFKDIQESCEPSMFSLEKLLFSIAGDSRSSVEVLKQVLPMVWHVKQKEIDGRKTLSNLGLKSSERLPARESESKKKKGRWAQEDDGDYECEICRTNLYMSLVTNSQEEGVYCLPHAIDLLTQKRHQLKYCKLMYTYTVEEMNDMVEKLEQRIENKCQKKLQSKPSTSGK